MPRGERGCACADAQRRCGKSEHRPRRCAVALFRIGTLVFDAPAPPAAGARAHRCGSLAGRFGTHVA
ncbi:hypothetical protein WK25_02035 [Burkholderia latens]|nr:hypothetical protein WK25_02035 [Burkholderia latens]